MLLPSVINGTTNRARAGMANPTPSFPVAGSGHESPRLLRLQQLLQQGFPAIERGGQTLDSGLHLSYKPTLDKLI